MGKKEKDEKVFFPLLTHPLQPFNLSEFLSTKAGQINNTRGENSKCFDEPLWQWQGTPPISSQS